MHVFYSPADFIISPLAGWAERSVTFGHAYLGGSITSVWKLVPWYPPGETPFSPVDLPEQPWFPLQGRVNYLQPRSHCGKPPSCLLSRPEVVFDPTSGLLLTDGLFPHKMTSQETWVPDVRSPTGFGRRELTPAELGDLWDVPISLMEALVTRPEGSQVIHYLLFSPPGKFLELGVDALLTNRCFRGVGHGSVPGMN